MHQVSGDTEYMRMVTCKIVLILFCTHSYLLLYVWASHLHIVHTVPQCFKGSVHHLSLPSPLLHDAGVATASDQPGNSCCLLHVYCAPPSNASSSTPITVVVPLPHQIAGLVCTTHHLLENVHHVAILWPVPIHHQHHLQPREGDPPDAAQALPQVVWVLLVGSDAEGHRATEVLRPGGAPHAPMLQEGKEALKEEVEGEEGTIETEGQVVLLSVDELVAFVTKKHSGVSKTHTAIIRMFNYVYMKSSSEPVT